MINDDLPFWTGHNRLPEATIFDAANPYHADFIKAAAIIRARVHDIKPEGDIMQLAAGITVPGWMPFDENQSPSGAGVMYADAVLEELKDVLAHPIPIFPEEFEKDNDANSHIDFVAAAANIRAMNYRMDPKDKLEVKRIAGKIIPAIATTTAMICGLGALEMYKIHSIEPKKVEDFRFASINLAISMFAISEALPCVSTTCPLNGEPFNLWTKWTIEGDLTLGQFIEAVKEKYKVDVDMATVGNSLLYASFQRDAKSVARMQEKISATLVNEFDARPLGPGHNLIQLQVVVAPGDDDVDVDIPQFLLKVK